MTLGPRPRDLLAPLSLVTGPGPGRWNPSGRHQHSRTRPARCAVRASPLYVPCSSTRQLPVLGRQTNRQFSTMSRCTGGRQPRLRCDQLDTGILRWPHQIPENPRLPAASVFCCCRAECIADAATFFHERGHRGTYQQFPESAILTTRNAQQLANDPFPRTRSAHFHAPGYAEIPRSDGDLL